MKNLSIKCPDIWALCLGIILFSGVPSWSAEILLDDYRGRLSPRWTEKSFKGNTSYMITREDNFLCIKAQSHSAASALYYKINYDPRQYPFLTWRWKVAHVISKGDARHKQGDDYAARVYVVFPSIIFWKTKAINYIWANKLPLGHAVPNPFTENAIMIAVQSGPDLAGQWIEERRNVFEDYRRHFKKDPPKTGAIAIMTDTDNTGEEATAWYGPIRALENSTR